MPKYLKVSFAVFIAGLVILTSFSAGLYVGLHKSLVSLEDTFGYKDLSKIREVISAIDSSYVEKISKKKLIEGSISGIVKSLDDPYSNYLNKKHFGMFKEGTTGYFDGIGIIIGMKNEKITVTSPLQGTPAVKAGIKAGDVITKIDGKSTEKMSLDTAVKNIRGKRGTMVKLEIYRESSKKTLKFSIVRDKILLPNVTKKKFGEVGYLMVHSFNEETTKTFNEKLNELIGEGSKGLIIDLRNNPGGLLEQAIDISSLFIESGPIVKTKGRISGEKTYNAKGGANTKIPIVVLVNHGSASASEIFAGAIQDYKRGSIIGERTFGKASVQQVEQLSDGSALTITIAKYYTPKGRSIAKSGIKPDIIIKLKNGNKDDIQLKKAKEVINKIIEK